MKSKNCICDSIYGIASEQCEPNSRYLCRARDSDQDSKIYFEGKQVSFENSVEAAAEILAYAAYPLFTGIDNLGVGAQQVAVNLAKLSGAAIDINLNTIRSSISSLYREGVVTASLGEVISRSQYLIAVDCDIADSYPRLFEELIERRGIELFWIGTSRPPAYCHDYLKLPDKQLANALVCVEAIVEGSNFNSSRLRDFEFESKKNVSDFLTHISGFLERIKSLSHVCVFTSGKQNQSEFECNADIICSVVKKLNRHCRCVLLGMENQKNELGARHVLAWSTGFPQAVDLSQTSFQSYGLEYTSSKILSRKECDVIVSFGASDEMCNLLNESESDSRALILIRTVGSASPDKISTRMGGKALVCDQFDIFRDDFLRLDELSFGVEVTGEARRISVGEFLLRVQKRLQHYDKV